MKTTTKSTRLSRFGRTYVAAVFVVGAVVVVHSVYTLIAAPIGYAWVVLALLTLVSSSFSVKIPGVPISIAISETFVYAIILLFGSAPATVTAGIVGLVTVLRRRNLRVERVLFNFAEPMISTWVAAAVFAWVAGIPPLSVSRSHLGAVVLPALGMSGMYFLSNSLLNAAAVASETGTSALQLWRKYFLWLSLNSFGGSSIAVLLAVNGAGLDLSGIGVIVPLLVISYLTFKTSMARVEDANLHLGQVNKLFLSTVETLAMAIDAKDQVTHGHIRRVQAYAVGLARVLGVTDEREIKAIEAAALLHDMGKLAVPEHILNKPGKLTPAEYERMKLHAPVGAEILSAIDFPYPVVPIVRHHHESWDGTGYPDRIAGDAIPIGARILAVVDCYDALTSDRPYRRALSDSDALGIIRDRRGTMYDPAVVDAFSTAYADLAPDEAVLPVNTSALAHVARTTLERHEASPPMVGPASPSSRNFGEDVLRVCELSERLAGLADLEDAGEIVARHVRRLTPARLVVFYTVDSNTDELVVGHASGEGAQDVTALRIPLGTGLSGWVAANRATIVNSDAALDFGQRSAPSLTGLGSTIGIPLVSGANLVGVLSLYATGVNAFTNESRVLVELIAREIAPLIERAVEVEHTRRDGLRDAVTGFFDQRYLEQLIASPAFVRGSLAESMGVLSVSVPADSDATSQVERDTRLLHAAAAVRQSVRIADMAFRRGEREVVVLMPNCDPTAGQVVSERVVAALHAERDGGGGAELEVGFACAPGHGTTVSALLDAARARASDFSSDTLFRAGSSGL